MVSTQGGSPYGVRLQLRLSWTGPVTMAAVYRIFNIMGIWEVFCHGIFPGSTSLASSDQFVRRQKIMQRNTKDTWKKLHTWAFPKREAIIHLCEGRIYSARTLATYLTAYLELVNSFSIWMASTSAFVLEKILDKGHLLDNEDSTCHSCSGFQPSCVASPASWPEWSSRWGCRARFNASNDWCG